MERVLAPANLRRAYQRVVSNKGAPGADGMTVADLAGYVRQYWPTLKARLLAGEYQPQAVRAVEIPKPQGGTRQLGIPSVVDRLIQQALQQHYLVAACGAETVGCVDSGGFKLAWRSR
ncbi:group II intron-encoding maturase [Pseudomonas putida ND6]|uniref:Group II intron-encoding maturase n=1 Tax=Pseudomonas putida ND6 TaxID=231023 RepID=I3UXF7_PSEPU|nr:group II intron-encoding maturase [Pseudomonas putida ND6]